MEGKSGFSPLAPSPLLALAEPRVCAHTRVPAREASGTPALSRLLPPPLSQDPPCWLLPTAATASTGRHLDQMNYGAKKRTLSAPRSEVAIFHVLGLGEGRFGVFIGCQWSWKRSCKSNKDRLMICKQGFLGV